MCCFFHWLEFHCFEVGTCLQRKLYHQSEKAMTIRVLFRAGALVMMHVNRTRKISNVRAASFACSNSIACAASLVSIDVKGEQVPSKLRGLLLCGLLLHLHPYTRCIVAVAVYCMVRSFAPFAYMHLVFWFAVLPSIGSFTYIHLISRSGNTTALGFIGRLHACAGFTASYHSVLFALSSSSSSSSFPRFPICR